MTLYGAGSNEFGQLSTELETEVTEGHTPRSAYYCAPQKLSVNSVRWCCPTWSVNVLRTNKGCELWGLVDGATGCRHSLLADSYLHPSITCNSLAACWTHALIISKTGSCQIYRQNSSSTTPTKCLTLHSPNQRYCQVNAGNRHAMLLTNNGDIVQLDYSDGIFIEKPISLQLRIKTVSCGYEHTLLLSGIGTVFSIGKSSRGQLGHGTLNNEDEPRVVEALEGIGISRICAGGWHSAAISDIGDLYVWGWNESSQLGLPCKHGEEGWISVAPFPVLVDLPNLDDTDLVCEISAGSRHTLALIESGLVYSWGWNAYGQLGHGHSDLVQTPTQIKVFENIHIKAIFAGGWNSFFLTDTETL